MDLIPLAIKHIEAENHHDVPGTMETIAGGGAEYRVYSNMNFFSSREKIKDFYSDIIDAVPDMNVEVENIIQDKERMQVFAQYKFTGTHKGNLNGLLPTNKKIVYHGAILYEFDEQGKLIKEYTYFDKTELLATIGIIKNPNTDMGMFWLMFLQSPIYAIRCAFASFSSKKKK
jgi:steroid delta-isomerase-like uncharacterized protein